MSEKGVIAVDRGVFDHECFADEPFTEREAWMWLIAEATWKARTRRIGRAVVSLRRGQLAASVRFMATRWGWSKSAVDRYISKLKNRDMVETENGTGINVITICNYNTYQRVSLPDGTDTGTQSGTEAGQKRDKREDIKSIEEEDTEAKASDAGASPQVPVYTDSKHELWGEGVPILTALGVPERSARSNIGRWLRDAKEDAQAVLGAIQRARDNRVIDPIPWITRAISSKGPANATENPRSLVSVGRRVAADFAREAGLDSEPSEPVLRVVSQS